MNYATVSLAVLAVSAAVFFYTYFGYPAVLWVAGRIAGRPLPEVDEDFAWPRVSISVPVYNEAGQIHELIETLLALDYPRDRLEILIVSDASSDGTDEAVKGFADRGVRLLRMEERGGKTKAENEAAKHLTGDIVLNTDASIRIPPESLKRLVRVFRDPSVGLASGRDVSVTRGAESGNLSESGYVGYEMKIRELETRVRGIVGASGCYYAIRTDLHRIPLPDSLSRDFAAAMHTYESGHRAVSVSDAVCYVPRTHSLHREYERKVRTITRGMETLWYKRALLNPLRHTLFAWMLTSHKLCRWLLPWLAALSWLALGALAPVSLAAAVLFAAGAALFVTAEVGWILANRGGGPAFFMLPTFAVAGNVAAARALIRFLRGDQDPLWEPTRR